MKRYECRTGGHNKFYEVILLPEDAPLDKYDVTQPWGYVTRYGKIGSNPTVRIYGCNSKYGRDSEVTKAVKKRTHKKDPNDCYKEVSTTTKKKVATPKKVTPPLPHTPEVKVKKKPAVKKPPKPLTKQQRKLQRILRDGK